jgi:hypothetical protein
MLLELKIGLIFFLLMSLIFLSDLMNIKEDLIEFFSGFFDDFSDLMIENILISEHGLNFNG